MKYFSLAILCLLLVTPLLSKAQQVSNIHFEQIGKQIHIYYDLQGEGTYNVKVFCSTNNGQSWGESLQKVTGAVGREKLTGEISFKVEATSLFDIEMVFVKGGTFQMGCTSEQSNCDDNEKPVHTVTVDDFYIGKYEITQKQWRDVMGNNPSVFFSGCDECPIESVSWDDIQKFLKKLNQKTGEHFRLPTEAEWEFAARGGNQNNGYKYAGSNNINEVAWYKGNSDRNTHVVGSKSPNELGIYDMSGNVWEWCNDWYGEYYYGNSPSNNPQGPTSGTYRILRGGSWYNDAGYFRVTYRGGDYPVNSISVFGFRVVR